MMLGTNNLSSSKSVRNTNDQTIAGLKMVVSEIRQHQPHAKLLLLAIFPRSKSADSPYRADLAVINPQLAKLDDGKNIFFMDIGNQFLNEDGSLKTELFADGNLHPNAAGYKVWAESILQKIMQMLVNK